MYREGNGAVIPLTQYIETLPNGREHLIIKMGDNRDNSQDSRVLSAVGYVPAENLIGRAEFIFFSTDGSARLWELWKWPFAIRYGRLFRGVN